MPHWGNKGIKYLLHQNDTRLSNASKRHKRAGEYPT